MAELTEKQLNNRFSVLPPEFLGKDGSARFQKSGGKRLNSSTVLTGALLATRENVLGNGCKTSYSDINRELGHARATIADNVAQLTHSGIFSRFGQSQYTAAYSLDTNHGLQIYHFLCKEKFNGVQLSGNDVIYLCNVIRFYLRDEDERGQKYFIGGASRVSSFLKCAESTACEVVNRLLKAKAMQRFVLINGKLKQGKGINKSYQTVYTVDKDILKRVKNIHKAINKQKADKEALRKLFSEKSEPKPAVSSKPRKRSLTDQWQSTLALMQEQAENSAEAIAKRFANDFTFNQLKRDYISTNKKYFEAIKQSNGQDTAATSELEKKLDTILSDVLNYLQAHNVPRTYIPDDWQAFVREILKP